MAKRESGKENKVLFSRKSKPKEPTNKIKKLAAFTLAEVLITLVIIGVVAALTIPSVVVSYQKHETVTRLKKVYTTLSQTTNKAISDYGPIKTWEIAKETGNNETKAFVDKYIAPYLNVAKNCEYDTEGACRFERANLKDPSTRGVLGESYYKLVLADGSLVVFQNAYANSSGYDQYYSWTLIDINGKKGPNVYGKDLFIYSYWIKADATVLGPGYKDYSGKFLPMGVHKTNNNRTSILSNCNKQSTGTYCSTLIMLDGWQIKDDYPW